MGWIEKAQSAPFENQPIPGLYFLDGDRLAKLFKQDWTKGQKYPTIVFPSGIQCDLWESSDPTNAVVHISGEMDLSLNATRDAALAHAQAIAEQVGYLVRKSGEQGIDVFGTDEEHILIIYDSTTQQMANVLYIQKEAIQRPQPELVDQKTGEQLPPLYSGEKVGLEALAQVKFFTPDGSWAWYASEFDGEDIFFGLVDGFEMELGYFSLAELSEARGALGLPVERDRYFKPTSLKNLKTIREQEHATPVFKQAIPQKEPSVSENDNLFGRLKKEILSRFGQLPAEDQATMGLELVNRIMGSAAAEEFKSALARQYLNTTLFPLVSRADLEMANFTANEIAQIT